MRTTTRSVQHSIAAAVNATLPSTTSYFQVFQVTFVGLVVLVCFWRELVDVYTSRTRYPDHKLYLSV